MRWIATLGVAAIISLAGSIATAQEQLPPGIYLPEDAGASDQGFASYRAELLLAAKRRDIDKVLSLSHPEIHLDFGGGTGLAEFGARLSEPTTELWDELVFALEHGSWRNDDGTYSAPYWFAMPTEGAYDPFTTAFAPGWNLQLHKGRGRDTPVIGTVSYGFVLALEPYAQPLDGDGFQLVRTADGAEGYMHISDLRSIVAHRAGFEEQDGRWRMIFFIAGD